MSLVYPNEQEENRQFSYLFSKPEWTISQAVFLIFGKLYVFQDTYAKEYSLDASFFFCAAENDGQSQESRLYSRAVRCIKANVLNGKWIESEHDYRIKPADFIKWAVSHDIKIGSRIYLELETLTKDKAFPYKIKIQEKAKEFLYAYSVIDDDTLPVNEIIAFVRGEIFLDHKSDKTLRNYIGEIKDFAKRKRGRPRKSSQNAQR